ncbi:hypothetical protein HZC33_02410 [Candidatus Wolfebacteria bacterium]|nr:hypothetical protein [Candidatus Wolfebacteria bacterium]
MKNIIKFFDKLEDKIRARLSRKPIIYAIIGGVGIVLFWRGVWHLADEIGLSALFSIIISMIMLLSTGLFVSFFIGHHIILSGIKREKKIEEREESEIKTEMDILQVEAGILEELKNKLIKIEKDIEEIKLKK